MELVDYQLGEYTLVEHKKKVMDCKNDFDPMMFDYCFDNTSVRMEHIKGIENEQERINEMTLYLDELFNKFPLPKEWLEWYARDLLGLSYKEYEIRDMKRKYRIEQKRLKKQREQDEKIQKKLDKENKKKMRMKKGNYTLKFY